MHLFKLNLTGVKGDKQLAKDWQTIWVWLQSTNNETSSFNTTLLHVQHGTLTTTDWQSDKTGDQQLQMIYKQDKHKSYKYYMFCIS